jgi:hypothetical protein
MRASAVLATLTSRQPRGETMADFLKFVVRPLWVLPPFLQQHHRWRGCHWLKACG